MHPAIFMPTTMSSNARKACGSGAAARNAAAWQLLLAMTLAQTLSSAICAVYHRQMAYVLMSPIRGGANLIWGRASALAVGFAQRYQRVVEERRSCL